METYVAETYVEGGVESSAGVGWAIHVAGEVIHAAAAAAMHV